MRLRVRIVHGSTESTLTDTTGGPAVEFFCNRAAEWANGRRHGDIEFNADQGRALIAFADITAFSVDVSVR